MRALSKGEFILSWGQSGNRGKPICADLSAIWPNGCVAEAQSLHCGPAGLVGNLGVKGVGKAYSAAMVRVIWLDGQTRVYTLTAAQPTVQLYGAADDQRGRFDIVTAYTLLGVEHILTGFDHLLFVVCLLFLVGFNRRPGRTLARRGAYRQHALGRACAQRNGAVQRRQMGRARGRAWRQAAVSRLFVTRGAAQPGRPAHFTCRQRDSGAARFVGLFDDVFNMNKPDQRRLRRSVRQLLLCLGAALLPTALAHQYYAKSFTIIHPWALPTEAGGNSAAVYLTFEEISAGDRLLATHASMAGQVQLRGAAAIDLPAGTTVELKPGTAYLELTALTAPLPRGRTYPMTLQFEKSGTIEVMASIGAH